MLQSQGLAKYAPPTLPDEGTLRSLVSQTIPAQTQAEWLQNLKANKAYTNAGNTASTGSAWDHHRGRSASMPSLPGALVGPVRAPRRHRVAAVFRGGVEGNRHPGGSADCPDTAGKRV